MHITLQRRKASACHENLTGPAERALCLLVNQLFGWSFLCPISLALVAVAIQPCVSHARPVSATSNSTWALQMLRFPSRPSWKDGAPLRWLFPKKTCFLSVDFLRELQSPVLPPYRINLALITHDIRENASSTVLRRIPSATAATRPAASNTSGVFQGRV